MRFNWTLKGKASGNLIERREDDDECALREGARLLGEEVEFDPDAVRFFLKELEVIGRLLLPAGATKRPKGRLNLLLLHGRDEADADMQDTGYIGPVLHDLSYCHVTYMGFVNVHRDLGVGANVLSVYDGKLQLIVTEEDAVRANWQEGKRCTFYGIPCRVAWFGDWEVVGS